MAVFIYSDIEERKPFTARGPIDPHKPYLKHVENWFYLRLIYSNGTTIDKLQATKELAICDRKLEYWSRKPTFDQAKVEVSIKEMGKQWNLEFTPNSYDALQQRWLKQLK